MKMEVAIKAENGPKLVACMSFRGRINKLIIKIPKGGIQIFLKMDGMCVEPLHTY